VDLLLLQPPTIVLNGNAEGAVTQFGVSPSICTKMPTEKDFKLTEQKRLDVLRRINALVRNWVRNLSEGRIPAEQLDSVGGKLFTFGSYRFGVHTSGVLTRYVWRRGILIAPTFSQVSTRCLRRTKRLRIYMAWRRHLCR